MKTISKILVIAVFFVGMTSATAQQNRKIDPEKIIKFLDKDKDGKISLDEAKKARKKTLAENFTKLDKNEDGYLDIKELKAMQDKKKS